MNDGLLSEREAAPRLGWSEAALKFNRRRGNAPAFYRFNRKIFYKPSDLEIFMERNRFEHGGSALDNNTLRGNSRG